ncbi:type VII secretion protein EssA [Metabacillus fastidiosus]|uniref:type VII secretion protein EssA n=1 Tax=Metabacillus fastidiosus TaxID=1458 RepID=UPI002E1A3EFA|nr:type VII secretion protein EssA [Metabacillus fastidiosus]MED4533981.1 type VII secretion protein EssA [Metabacillus fastidiosus]
MRKLKILLLAISCVIFQQVLIDKAAAEEEIDVEPNEYEEKKIDLDTKYFHDSSLLKQKKQLPEELKKITFTKKDQTFYEDVKESLFTKETEINNTVEAKVAQLQLFTAVNANFLANDDTETEEKSGNSHYFLILLIGVAVICMAILFFVIIPKLKLTEGKIK